MTIIKAKSWCNNIYKVASERCSSGGGASLSFLLAFAESGVRFFRLVFEDGLPVLARPYSCNSSKRVKFHSFILIRSSKT